MKRYTPMKPILIRLSEIQHQKLDDEVLHRATVPCRGYMQPDSKAEIIRDALRHYFSWIEAERKEGRFGR